MPIFSVPGQPHLVDAGRGQADLAGAAFTLRSAAVSEAAGEWCSRPQAHHPPTAIAASRASDTMRPGRSRARTI